MVNDTTTLNGALSELGETIADNLESMGVTGADASDGLTTLAGKILDIEKGIILTTSVQCVASASEITVGESVLLTATLSANYDDSIDLYGKLGGATIKFKQGNTVIGTGVTDVNGVASYTFTPDTTGTYTITAVFEGSDNFDGCTSAGVSVTVKEAVLELSVHASQDIIQSGDSTTITASLTDGTSGMSGRTLSYQIKHGSTIITSGSDTTDTNGEIQFTYVGTAIGDVTIIVSYDITVIKHTGISAYVVDPVELGKIVIKILR